MLVPGSSVNLENPGLDTITHPALLGVPVKHCLQGGGKCCVSEAELLH